MVDKIAGYHFDMQFGPTWQGVAPLVIERARAAGISVSHLGHELRPRVPMIRVAGTYWAGLRTGDVHFQLAEYRSELDGFLLQEMCLTSKQVLWSFGVGELEGPKGWTLTKLSKGVGLWIRNGSLLLHGLKDDRVSLEEQVLADFDMWQALDAMVRLAAGEPSFGSPFPQTGPAGKSTPYPEQPWARGFEAKVTAEPAKVSAGFNSPRLMVAGAVTLMERS